MVGQFAWIVLTVGVQGHDVAGAPFDAESIADLEGGTVAHVLEPARR